MKRIVSLSFLCCLMLVSCGSIVEPTEITTIMTEATTVETEPAIPIKDFGNGTISIYIRYDTEGYEWNVSDLSATEEIGEPINDAVYRRNANIMDRYNVNLDIIKSNSNSCASTVRSSVMAGEDAYDIVILSAYDMVTLSGEDMLIDLLTLDSIDTNAPYWNPTLSESLTLGGKLYFAMGDLSSIDNRAVRCLYFNKDLFDRYNLEYPYESVLNGSWTYDKFFEQMEVGTVDLDGNGIYNDDDQWGLFVQPTIGTNLYYASGRSFIGKGSNGKLTTEFNDKRSIEVMQRISELVKANEDNMVQSYEFQKYLTLFAENKSLFYAEVLYFTEYYRQYDFNFGILPMPKYDETQENYQQFADGNCLNLCGIPITNTNSEDTALLLEALSAESVETLTPAFYDVCLIGKHVRDNESADMLDIIFSSYVVDYANLFQLSVANSLNEALLGLRDVASTVQSSLEMTQARLDEINETYN